MSDGKFCEWMESHGSLIDGFESDGKFGGWIGVR
jgi:hypothetical protein